MKWFFSVCLITMGVLPLGEIAIASPFYNMGKNAAESLAESAWNNLGKDCRKVQTFVKIIKDGKKDAEGGTIYQGRSAKAFGSGYQDGLSYVLVKVCSKCQQRGSKCQRRKGVTALLTELEQLSGKKPDATVTNKKKETDGKRPPSRHGNFYNMGKNIGQKMADNAWRNLRKSCSNINAFRQMIEDSMDDVAADIGTKYKGQSAKDFGSGYIAGLSGVLTTVRGNCSIYVTGNCRLDSLKQACELEFTRLEKLSGDSRSFYNQGRKAAKRLAESARKNLDIKLQKDCKKADKFADIIEKGINDAVASIGTKYKGSSAVAFHSGYIAGLSSVLAQVDCVCKRDKSRSEKLINRLKKAAKGLN